MCVVDHGFLKRTVIDRKIGYGNVHSHPLSVALYVLVIDASKLVKSWGGGGGGVASNAERLVKENDLKLFDVIENLLSIKFTVSVKR